MRQEVLAGWDLAGTEAETIHETGMACGCVRMRADACGHVHICQAKVFNHYKCGPQNLTRLQLPVEGQVPPHECICSMCHDYYRKYMHEFAHCSFILVASRNLWRAVYSRDAAQRDGEAQVHCAFSCWNLALEAWQADAPDFIAMAIEENRLFA